MASTKKSVTNETQKYADEAERELSASLTQQVMNVLGLPANLQSVQVRRLWNDRFRLNVLVGGDATTTTVAHSFFLAVGEDGLIAESTPPITRRYGQAGPPESGKLK
jgi:hypothetical protein